jgi:hypothetical protein
MSEKNTALGDLLGHVLGVLAEALERRLFCRGLVGIGETRSVSEPDLDEHGEGFDEEVTVALAALLVPLDPIQLPKNGWIVVRVIEVPRESGMID